MCGSCWGDTALPRGGAALAEPCRWSCGPSLAVSMLETLLPQPSCLGQGAGPGRGELGSAKGCSGGAAADGALTQFLCWGNGTATVGSCQEAGRGLSCDTGVRLYLLLGMEAQSSP